MDNSKFNLNDKYRDFDSTSLIHYSKKLCNKLSEVSNDNFKVWIGHFDSLLEKFRVDQNNNEFLYRIYNFIDRFHSHYKMLNSQQSRQGEKVFLKWEIFFKQVLENACEKYKNILSNFFGHSALRESIILYLEVLETINNNLTEVPSKDDFVNLIGMHYFSNHVSIENYYILLNYYYFLTKESASLFYLKQYLDFISGYDENGINKMLNFVGDDSLSKMKIIECFCYLSSQYISRELKIHNKEKDYDKCIIEMSKFQDNNWKDKFQALQDSEAEHNQNAISLNFYVESFIYVLKKQSVKDIQVFTYDKKLYDNLSLVDIFKKLNANEKQRLFQEELNALSFSKLNDAIKENNHEDFKVAILFLFYCSTRGETISFLKSNISHNINNWSTIKKLTKHNNKRSLGSNVANFIEILFFLFEKKIDLSDFNIYQLIEACCKIHADHNNNLKSINELFDFTFGKNNEKLPKELMRDNLFFQYSANPAKISLLIKKIRIIQKQLKHFGVKDYSFAKETEKLNMIFNQFPELLKVISIETIYKTLSENKKLLKYIEKICARYPNFSSQDFKLCCKKFELSDMHDFSKLRSKGNNFVQDINIYIKTKIEPSEFRKNIGINDSRIIKELLGTELINCSITSPLILFQNVSRNMVSIVNKILEIDKDTDLKQSYYVLNDVYESLELESKKLNFLKLISKQVNLNDKKFLNFNFSSSEVVMLCNKGFDFNSFFVEGMKLTSENFQLYSSVQKLFYLSPNSKDDQSYCSLVYAQVAKLYLEMPNVMNILNKLYEYGFDLSRVFPKTQMIDRQLKVINYCKDVINFAILDKSIFIEKITSISFLNQVEQFIAHPFFVKLQDKKIGFDKLAFFAEHIDKFKYFDCKASSGSEINYEIACYGLKNIEVKKLLESIGNNSKLKAPKVKLDLEVGLVVKNESLYIMIQSSCKNNLICLDLEMTREILDIINRFYEECNKSSISPRCVHV